MPQDIKSLRNRIKSVKSTLHLTKAMGLVASSKIRKAQEARLKSEQYKNALGSIVDILSASQECEKSPYMSIREGKAKIVVIAGDRGLAGGYNANVFRLTETLSKGEDAIFLPIGKKALEYYKNRKREIFSDAFEYVAETGVGSSLSIAEEICSSFSAGEIGRVVLVYTKFMSMISQVPAYEEILPLEKEENASVSEPLIEGEPEELLAKIIPQYVGGIIYSAVCEALASESGARRSSMNAANKNAEEMIGALMLKYNRARQAVITQEITEIVSGAEAL